MFKDDWTEKYVIILCQIQNISSGTYKSGNVKHYYKTTHNHFKWSYLIDNY